ncbi:MAG: outer membrane lipoprotein-sorting protein [Wenzhouxiangellaceae bacterium]|nr:outer membrane lipoprotein-sorting protein [Wenzhouxiangellaceae bacterium]
MPDRITHSRAARSAALITLLVLSALVSAAAPGPQPDAQTLVRATLDNHLPRTRISLESMTLQPPNGSPRTRKLLIIQRNDAQASRTLLRFLEPARLRGTTLLTINQVDRQGTDQWIHLPELGDVRRIPASGRGNRFAGSDFLFEDLSLEDVTEQSLQFIDVRTINDIEVARIEAVPACDAMSSYARRVLWIELPRRVLLRIDFFRHNRREPIKRYETLQMQEVDGRQLITEAQMIDLESDHRTLLSTEAMDTDRSLPDSLFMPRALTDPRLDQWIPTRPRP